MTKTYSRIRAGLPLPGRYLRSLVGSAGLLTLLSSAPAAILNWDPSATGAGSDGSGTWSSLDANWATGSGAVVWDNAGGHTAVFGSGGAAGTVSVDGAVSAAELIFNSGTTGTYTVSGGTISTSAITANADATITSAIAGSGVLTKAGTGTLTFNGTTSGVSTINVSAGTLKTSTTGTGSFGNSATAVNVATGAKIQVASGSVVANAITFNGGAGDSAVIGGSTLSGPITLASGNTVLNVGSRATISGTISGSGALTKGGTNKLVLTGSNTFSGGTTISDGVLEVGANGALGTGAVGNQSVLTFNAGGSELWNVANAISGIGSITKSGDGTLVLSGANTYTGATTISGGKLLVSGSMSGSAIYVGGGATLGGTGTIVGAITLLSGGILSPGMVDAVGSLVATSIAWTSNNLTAGMLFNLGNGGLSDLLTLTGAFTRSSGTSYIFDFQGTGLAGSTYTLVKYGSTSSTSVANLVATNLKPGYTANFSFSNNSLQVTVVPEPAEYGVALAAFGLLVIIGRRFGFRNMSAAVARAFNLRSLGGAVRGVSALLLAAMVLPAAKAETVTINLETATFDELQAAMNAGALTSVELATLYLNRRAVYDQAGVKLNSVVALNPNILDEAAAADAERAANGQTSPLLGLMFCVKDSYPTKNMVTTAGVKAWLSPVTGTTTGEQRTYGPMIPPEDCFAVEKLKAAGAILLGHGNMDTWATSASSTTSNAYGTTINAYMLGTAAGSSGGPAVLTGANFASFGFGGETGGSIRNPSDRAGITGFKVSVGTISVNHIVPLVADRDVIGPMAKYVKDEAYVMDVAATTLDPQDPWYTVNYFPGRPLSSGYASKLATATLAGKKIGVIGTYNGQSRPDPAPTPVQLPEIGMTGFPTTTTTNTTSVQTADAAIQTIFNRAITQLESQGATVTTVFLPPNLDTARALPAYDDGTIAPTRLLTVSPNNTAALASENKGIMDFFDQGIITRLTQANAASSSLSIAVRDATKNGPYLSFTDSAAVTHFATQAIYQQIFEKWMASQGLDALIWPTHSVRTRTSGTVVGRDLVNNLGLPTCTVPMGIVPSTGEPITMAICGRYRMEADILALAYAYQQAYNYRIPSTLAPPLDGETITYTTGEGATAALRVDKSAPVVSVKKNSKVVSNKVVIEGVATDVSGIKSLKVYVNGRKIAAKAGKRWTASVPVGTVKKWTKARKVEVTVLAKDGAGNSSATVKSVSL